MPFGPGTAAHRDVSFGVNLGQFKRDMAGVKAEYERTTGAMSTEAIRAANAQEKLDRALAKHGPDSYAARTATVAFRREMQSLERETRQETVALDRAQREMGQLARGAVVGTGALHGMARTALFAGSTFLGGAGLVAGIKMASDVASNLAEQTSKVERIFGSSAPTIEAWGKTTAGAFGIADDKALEAASTFGNLFTTVGLAPEKNAALSRSLVELAADLASFNNASPEDALEALRSGVIGEAEPMRRFGALLSETRVQQEALRQTGKKHAADLTDQEKLLARVALIFRDTAKAQGDYALTSGGLANQQRTLSANLRDLAGTVGTELNPEILAITTGMNKWLSSSENQERVQRDVHAVVETGTGIVHGFADAVDDVAPLINGVVDALGGFEHAVETALIAGLLLKARRAASGFGLITAASARTRTAIVADAAVEQAALSRVGTAGAAGAAGAAGGAARGAVIGGVLGRGAGLLRAAGWIGAGLAAIDIVNGKIPFTGRGIPGDNFGWGDLVGAVAQPFQGVRTSTSGPAALRWADVYEAITMGLLTPAMVRKLKSRFVTDGDYNGALAYAEQIEKQLPRVPGSLSGSSGGFTVPGSLRGSSYLGPTGAAALTPYERAQFAVSEHPGQVGPLRTERALLDQREAFLRRALVGAAPKRAREVMGELKATLAEQQQIDDQIQSIRDAATKTRLARAKKAQDARSRLIADAIPNLVGGSVAAEGALLALQAGAAAKLGGTLGSFSTTVAGGGDAVRQILADRASASKERLQAQTSLGEQLLSNALAEAQLRETLAGKNVQAVARAKKAERRIVEAQVDFYNEQARAAQKVNAAAWAAARAQAIAAQQRLADLKAASAGQTAGGQQQAFIGSLSGILGDFASDTTAFTPRTADGKLEVHIHQDLRDRQLGPRGAMLEAREAALHLW